jgi:hypothetical protein
MIWAGMQAEAHFSELDARARVVAEVYLAMAEASAKSDEEAPEWLRGLRIQHRAFPLR